VELVICEVQVQAMLRASPYMVWCKNILEKCSFVYVSNCTL